jgi:phosphotransferase system  glucose/maltose/N-acetylglucosamine-specific IIC component
MTWLILALVPYILVALFVVRPIAGHVAWGAMWAHQTRPDGTDWMCGLVVGLIAGALWPLAAVWIFLSRATPKIGREREALLKAREERIRELQSELDLIPCSGQD